MLTSTRHYRQWLVVFYMLVLTMSCALLHCLLQCVICSAEKHCLPYISAYKFKNFMCIFDPKIEGSTCMWV